MNTKLCTEKNYFIEAFIEAPAIVLVQYSLAGKLFPYQVQIFPEIL